MQKVCYDILMRYFLHIIIILILLSCNTSNQPDQPADITKETEIPEISDVLPDPYENLGNGNPEIGWAYISSTNRGKCLECHSIAGDGNLDGWALDDTALRRDENWLAAFLDNPRNLRPEVATMPPYRGDEEAVIADVVAFLMTLDSYVDHPESGDIKPEGEPEPYHGGIGGWHGEEFTGY